MEIFILLLRIMQGISWLLLAYSIFQYVRAFTFDSKRITPEVFLRKFTRRKARALTWFTLVPQTILLLLYILTETHIADGLGQGLKLALSAASIDKGILWAYVSSVLVLGILNHAVRNHSEA
ncbi:MAG: hypothetical protein IJ112_07285 [Oscillospiraceae bacterium]|nr:hypothetical protein [Oscillospiraceae bacterium]